MLNSKSRAFLRKKANGIDTIFQVGKEKPCDNFYKQVDDALRARELIKLRVLETSMMSAREAADDISEKTGSETVQVIGTRFVLYRASDSLPAERRISIPK